MNAIFALRVVGILEGISYLLLLFIAMPLKYMFEMPHFVEWVGAAHGGLFVLFVICIAIAAWARKWSPWRMIEAFLSSLIPFGTFIMDRKWKREQNQFTNVSAT